MQAWHHAMPLCFGTACTDQPKGNLMGFSRTASARVLFRVVLISSSNLLLPGPPMPGRLLYNQPLDFPPASATAVKLLPG